MYVRTNILLRKFGKYSFNVKLKLFTDITSRRHLRSATRHHLTVPRYRLSTFGRRAFFVAGPTVWNSLPDSLCDPALASNSFRQSLKTNLFRRYQHTHSAVDASWLCAIINLLYWHRHYIDIQNLAYCLRFYDMALWHSYRIRSLNKFRSCYNWCIKIFLGYKRRDSLTSVLLDSGLPSFNTVLHNSSASFVKCVSSCSNRIVSLLEGGAATSVG